MSADSLRAGVVVPAHNEAETLGLTLEALRAQAWPGLRILVVNDGSTDGTSAVIARYPGVREIVNNPNLGLARSINVGLTALTEEGMEIGMVLHADCVPQGAGWVADMLAPFSDPGVGAVVSARKLASKPRGAERFFDAVAPQDFPNPEGRDREVALFRDKCDAYRLSALKELGGFDTKAFYVAGEDTDLSLRMRAKGLKILQSGRAEVAIGFSSHQRSLKRVFRKALQYGGAQTVLWRRHRYDGLKARAYAAGFLAVLALVPALLGMPLPSWLILAPSLYLLATTEVALPGLGGAPAVLGGVILGAALQGAGRPAAVAWSAGTLAVVLGMAVRQGLKAGRRLRSHGEDAPVVAGGVGMASAWWMLTGWGYGTTWLTSRAR